MNSRFRLTASGTALALGVVVMTALSIATGYRELAVLALAGLILLVLVFLLPRIASPIVLRRIGVPRLVQRTAFAEIILRVSADGVVPPVRIIDQLSGVAVPIDLPQLRADVPLTVRYRIQATRRGSHTVGPLLEERSDPFGLVVRTIEHDVRNEMLVHPFVHELKVSAHGVRQRERNSQAPRLNVDPLADFRTLREYVAGDDPRLIHWASTARTGALVVKDHFELRRALRFVVLETLDTSCTAAQFEEACEIAASIACDAISNQIQVVARTRDALSPGRAAPARDRNEVLEMFARVRRTPASDSVVAGRITPFGQDPDQIFLVMGAASPLVDAFVANGWTRHRLIVVRVSDRPAEQRRLPVATIDVRNADEFVARWRMGYAS